MFYSLVFSVLIATKGNVTCFSMLFWQEQILNRGGQIFKCKMDGADVQPLFSRRNHRMRRRGRERINRKQRRNNRRRRIRRSSSNCTCPPLSVSPVFTIDHTDVEKMEILVVDSNSGSIWASDLVGCQCRRVVDAANTSNTGT